MTLQLTHGITKFQLLSLLTSQSMPLVQTSNGMGILDSIQREDGSGRSFNVTVAMPGGAKETVYVRTID